MRWPPQSRHTRPTQNGIPTICRPSHKAPPKGSWQAAHRPLGKNIMNASQS